MSEEERNAEPKPAKKSFGWPFWLIVAVLISSFVGLTQPLVIRDKGKPDTKEAISNLRQIGIALYEFENEFGEFPNDNTAALINKKYPRHGHDLSGKSSNAIFRQFFVMGSAQSEEAMFYAKIPSTRRPDGDTAPGKLLEKGEVGFAYIAGLSPDGNPARPIAFAPVIPGTDRFDPKPFYGKAIILRVDFSVTSVNIDKKGHAMVGGKNLLSPENPIWDSKVIDIRYPE